MGKSAKSLPAAKRTSLTVALGAKVYEKKGMAQTQNKPKSPTKKK